MLAQEGIKTQLESNTDVEESKRKATSITEQPLRMEVFSAEQRMEKGRILAQKHVVTKDKNTVDLLLQRLSQNEAILRSVHRKLVDDVTEKKPITSVGEWLVDNFYIIEEQIGLAIRHLPKRYLSELPQVTIPTGGAIPRVYDIAEKIIAFGDGRVDIDDVSSVISAYQEVQPLNLGELWAIPIMLRLALIENIRRMAVLTEKCREDRHNAMRWADEIIKVEAADPKNVILAVADMARAKPELTNSFVAEFKRKLNARGSGLKLPLQWVEQHLTGDGASIEEAVSEENRIQAVMEISIRNSINSLRSLNVTDWKEFVENLSLVESTLRRDPAGVYANMDFSTRDGYRRTVEQLSKKSASGEVNVAEKCLALARAALEKGGDAALGHVGYYLIGDGEQQLKKAIGFKGGIGDFIRTASSRMTLGLYLGSITILTVFFTFAISLIAYELGVVGNMLTVLVILLAVSMCHVAVGLVNFASTMLVKPRPLPRLDFHQGIPRDMRTLVVVPMIINSEKVIRNQLKNLETHYLNNRGPYVHFALLTDFADATSEHMPLDDELLEVAQNGIRELNSKHQEKGGDNFFLLHRNRRWNETEKLWMGYERKRGKLEDLNRYLIGKDKTIFPTIEGRAEVLSGVQYVVTLDADTMMARDAAWQLVGTMAHPLVQPRYDAKLGRVIRGHGILQPRVDSGLSGANRSHYARMTASDIGIDPYTRVSSDVYQDLFDEGSFVGKGIYDVKTFDAALGGRFPDNKILSHDLLEGCVMRSGLINDVKFYEDPPASYLADIFRRHRWVRGDWQIANYLVAKVKNARNPLNLLSRWKIFDNLRRSLTPIVVLALLVLGLTILSRPGIYVLIVCCIFVIPLIINSVNSLVRKSPDNTFRQHFSNLFSTIGKEAVQAIFKFSCLPYEAYVNVDAIVRSLWRQCISRRLLLQWNPSDNTMREKVTHFGPILRKMWINPVFAVAMTAILRFTNREILPWALPLFILWLVAPVIVTWFSKPLVNTAEMLDPEQVDFLRKVSRRTWLFFEDFVNADNNWLPPDNYQEYPGGKVAARTSPTNMGLSLLSNLSAYDFGFATAGTLLTRTERTITTMCRMERYKGHFYNWYDTVSLRILHPSYISTVDSGNLAAHLMILISGLTSLRDEPIVDGRLFMGLKDTMDLAVEAFEGDGNESLFAAAMEKLRDDTTALAQNPPTALFDFYSEVLKLSERIDGILAELVKYASSHEDDTSRWCRAYSSQCKDIIHELEALTPWVREMQSIPEWGDVDFINDISSLNCLVALGDIQSLPRSLCLHVESAVVFAKKRLAEIEDIILRSEDLTNIEYNFLYDKAKRLLSIGYNVDERRLDASVYDLLASEARLATYLGIVQHKLPQSSWFALGRMLTKSGGKALLVSWSGSMFEYLMPLLVMPTVEETLLDETYKSVVIAQSKYGEGKGVPWGISESGYNVFDSLQNYQYRAFGVPELGLRHGLSDDLVIAPYASCLAAMVYPSMACRNLQRLVSEGVQTRYGFHEAIDYTPSRKPHGEESAVVRSYMVHHQGMSLVALGQALLGQPMHRRFQNHALLQSASMLLEEIIPDEKALYYHASYTPEIRTDTEKEESPVRVLTNPSSLQPEVQLLSNGNYSVMLSSSGAGYSRWRNVSLTRWREDGTLDNWGSFSYVRDHGTGSVWSTTYQPMPTAAASYEAIFSEGKAEFNRHDKYFDTHTEVVVSPEDDIEVRRIRIVNRTNAERRLDLTTFAEVVLSPSAADDSHQAFNKLFVETRLLKEKQAILCSRRPRSKEEKTAFLFHMLLARSEGSGVLSYETDRLQFIGRENDATHPAALFASEGGLTNSEGAVLDPVVSIRAPILLGPGEDMVFDIVTGVAETEEAVMSLIEKYHDERMTNKAFDLAWMHGQLLLRQLNISETDAQLYCHLASSIVYVNSSMRARPETLIRNYQGQSGLWGYSISGDLPIALVKITDPDHVQLVNEMIQAHAYWRLKGLPVDLVIWNDDQSGYRQTLHDQMTGFAVAALGESNLERPGGVFIRSVDRVSDEDKVLIQTVARVVLSDTIGSLSDHIRKQMRREFTPSTIVQYRPPQLGETIYPSKPLEKRKLLLENGYGGFSEDGTEYIVTTDKSRKTPLPWVNVIANDNFGTAVSESGSSYTWSENAHEFRLTPWYNDPVSDPTGEAIYIRDENGGDYWSPTYQPCRKDGEFVARHGFGYSIFEHAENGVFSELTIHVDREAPVKFMRVRVRNDSSEKRNFSVTAYVEWILGDIKSKTGMHVVTGIDSASGALFARNHYTEEFRGRTAFLDTDETTRTVGGDRREFIGRNGRLASPAAMQRTKLSGRVGPGFDPCGAMQVKFTLMPGREKEVVFRIGSGKTVDAARKLVQRFRGVGAAKASLERVVAYWKSVLGSIQVDTPDIPFNLMANGWLLYQSLSCRFWGRSATYQSGGAFGFRDQLQDSLAFLYSDPTLIRKHLLLSSEHQFVEGDAMHWWHPPGNRGVRTRCSDDYLWLPYVTEKYVSVTGDYSVLDEETAFIQGRPLKPEEESYYDLPSRSEKTGTLYEHCRVAIEHGLRFGEHGLPLMGSGDWNDGMDLVGIHGKGESVWLGFFLHVVLSKFAELAKVRKDEDFARFCQDEAAKLKINIEAHAWDDLWYRRAYFDDGTPLGSALNPECRIDSIAQSWSVISGVGEEKRTEQAMRSLYSHLVDRGNKIVKLFEPPFSHSELNPGYIKGYVPGVRENGGQYTHAAIWAVIAFAVMGDNGKAWELFNLINPVNHGLTREDADIYKIEPYVIAADVYAAAGHAGRGGWSWYTGSASWFYRLMIEYIVGFDLRDDSFGIKPCLPPQWDTFAFTFAKNGTRYKATVRRSETGESGPMLMLDGVRQKDDRVPLSDDGEEHLVEVIV